MAKDSDAGCFTGYMVWRRTFGLTRSIVFVDRAKALAYARKERVRMKKVLICAATGKRVG